MWLPLLYPVADKRLHDWLLLPVTLPLALILFVLLGCLIVLCAPFVFSSRWREGQRLRAMERSLRGQCRLLPWAEVEAKAEVGQGSLLVCPRPLLSEGTVVVREGPPLVEDFYQIWWVPQKPEQMEPAPLPLEEGLYAVAEGPGGRFARRYLAVQGGAASLAQSTGGLVEEEFLPRQVRQKFPKVAIVVLLPWRQCGAEPGAAPDPARDIGSESS